MKVNAADIMRRPCDGEGESPDERTEILYDVGRCPRCAGLVAVDRTTGKVEPHDVLVIGEDGEEE